MADENPSPAPAFAVVSGDPTPEELAVITVVLAAAAAGAETEQPAQPPSQWARPARAVRAPTGPGRDGWWASGLPR